MSSEQDVVERAKAWVNDHRDTVPFELEVEQAIDHIEALVAEVEWARRQRETGLRPFIGSIRAYWAGASVNAEPGGQRGSIEAFIRDLDRIDAALAGRDGGGEGEQ